MTMIDVPRLLPVLVIVAACASAPQALPTKTAPQAGTATDVANRFYKAMQANDVPSAEGLFSDELKTSMPPERLRETFDTLRSNLGELKWWQPTGEYRQTDSTRLVYRLEFDRGSMSGLVTLDLQSERMLSVQFQPPG